MVDSLQVLKTHDVVSKPVITLQGDEVGTVARVVVDPGQGKVVGLTFNTKGLFKGEKGVDIEAVKAFGDYAITIEDANLVVPLNNLPAIEKLSKECNMYNMRILTPEGKLVGTVDDFSFNVSTGQIEKYFLSGGLIKNLYKGRASISAGSIQTVGKDVIIAAADVETSIVKESGGFQDNLENLKDDLGNWRGDIDQWKDDFEKLWDKTRGKAQDLSKTVGVNLKEVAKTGTDKSKELFSKTGEVVTEKTEQLKKSYDWWMDRLQSVKTGGGQPITDEDAQSLIGLKAGKAVTDEYGNTIVEENQEVTGEVIDAAKKARKVKELLISVAARDLEDKMKSIEEDNISG